MTTNFTIRLHHGGKFVMGSYVNGDLRFVKDCDGDEFSMIELDSIVKDVGYHTYKNLWFISPMEGALKELRPLKTDKDAMLLVGCVVGLKEVDVFIEHDDNNVEELNLVGGNNLVRGDEVEYDDLDFYGTAEVRSESLGENVAFDTFFGENNEADVTEKMKEIFFDNLFNNIDVNWDISDCDSDDLQSLYDSSDEEEGGGPRYNAFKTPYDPKRITFKVGMLFESLEFFKSVVIDYAIHGYRNIHFLKCEKTRVRAKCAEGCEWLIYASFLPDGKTAQIKTYVDNHSCARTFTNKNMSAKWIAKNMLNSLRTQPEMKISTFQATVTETFGLGCSRGQAFRAKRMAIEMAEGDYKEQYGMVREYCEEVIRSNPGSTCVVKCSSTIESEGSNFVPRFERMYMCLAACKNGFLAGCMPLIGVDGCHLKGPCGGILLTAVSMDPNRQIFLIAVAAVEGENRDSWTWFLNLLLGDIGREKKWTFISDQHKGLVPALAEIFPDAEHRFCVRHLYNNFKKLHPGVLLKELMWAAARSTYVSAFEYYMMKVKAIKVEAWEWLSRTPPRQWSRSHFSFESKNPMLLNNISESFNAIILDAREKAVITMMDSIRQSLMEKFRTNREGVAKWKYDICPAIQARLEKEKHNVNSWITRFAGNDMFEISLLHHQFTVDLNERKCSCRKWELNGIPCVHTVSAIFFKRQTVEQYVDPCFSVQAYSACYSHMIYPINGRDMWPQTGLARPLPPLYNRAPGRPKKLRRRELEELPPSSKLSKQRTRMKCTRCNTYGHNRRSCRGTSSSQAVGTSAQTAQTAATQESTVLH